MTSPADGTPITAEEIEAQKHIPARALYATYMVGLTTTALVIMMKVIVPLWAVDLGMSPSAIGLAMGAGGLIPFILSIHGGTMMDRLGTRRITLIFAVLGAATMFLYPMLPWVVALFMLQLVSGYTNNVSWMGAQALIVQFGRGNTGLIAKFSFATRIGTVSGPIVIGAIWDVVGAWGAFMFCGLIGLGVVVCTYMVPARLTDADFVDNPPPIRMSDLVPRFRDYVQAFAMMAIPAVAFVVAVTFLRIASSSMQGSFYVVYLQGIGYTGTLIGVLLAMSEGGGMFGSFIAKPMEKLMAPHWVLLIFIALSLFFIAVTPYLGGIFVLLLIASSFRGSAQGLAQPVMFAVLSRAVSRKEQGMSIGLRTTSNRLATMIVPTMMGYIVEWTSIEDSFWIMGALLIGGCAVIALILRRIPGFKT
ncbi:MAG TPA: MFS transporter [Alphaproteobacteria bacterium]|jgi:predicted MFS family arabinose efflux permease